MAGYGETGRVVVSLGHSAFGKDPVKQEARIREIAPAILGLIQQGNEVILTHGNGSQVGMIQNAFATASAADASIPAMGLAECGAMSQGYIGYQLQQGLGVAMHKAYKRWHVATVVTQIEVDPDDPSFDHPHKPIGPYLTREQAEAQAAADPTRTYAEFKRGWRRVVASPEPKKIVEYESILNLLDNEFIVIACGGGGIPVVRDYGDKGAYKGVSAVIEKDAAAELLARDCQADTLLFLTAEDYAYENYDTPDQRALANLTADEAEQLADAGQFGRTSMEPKVRAAVSFCRSWKERSCLIGSIDKAAEVMAGLSGTCIHN